MIELDVYEWVRNCPECGASTPLVYANDPNSHSLIGIDLIAEALASLNFSVVKQGDKPGDKAGNYCIEWDEYLNVKVRTQMISEVQTTAPRTTITITPLCEHCEENEANRIEQGRPLCGSCTMRDLFAKHKNE